jgi:2-oxoisovalerate dehydrogenase E1 component
MDIDYAAIGSSLQKTGTLVIFEQAAESMAIGHRIIAQCQQRFFNYIKKPAVSITGADVPLPVSKHLEASAIPSLTRITECITGLVHGVNRNG